MTTSDCYGPVTSVTLNNRLTEEELLLFQRALDFYHNHLSSPLDGAFRPIVFDSAPAIKEEDRMVDEGEET